MYKIAALYVISYIAVQEPQAHFLTLTVIMRKNCTRKIYLHFLEHTKSVPWAWVETPGVDCAAAEELSVDIVPVAVLFCKHNADPMFTVLIYSIIMHFNRFVSFSPLSYSA